MDDELGALALKQLEPKRVSLPKWLLKHERVTWVLDGFVPPRDPSSERCPRCEKPLTRIVSLDLSAYAGAGLPRKTILILRCRNSSTCSIGDASRGPVAIVRVKVSGGDCPKGHREQDYPDLFDAGRLGKTSDRVDAALLEQREELGPHPRVGGWPNWGQCEYATAGWPNCAACNAAMVMAFESTSNDDEKEHALVCSWEGCAADGLLVVTMLQLGLLPPHGSARFE